MSGTWKQTSKGLSAADSEMSGPAFRATRSYTQHAQEHCSIRGYARSMNAHSHPHYTQQRPAWTCLSPQWCVSSVSLCMQYISYSITTRHNFSPHPMSGRMKRTCALGRSGALLMTAPSAACLWRVRPAALAKDARAAPNAAATGPPGMVHFVRTTRPSGVATGAATAFRGCSSYGHHSCHSAALVALDNHHRTSISFLALLFPLCAPCSPSTRLVHVGSCATNALIPTLDQGGLWARTGVKRGGCSSKVGITTAIGDGHVLHPCRVS